MDEDLDQAWNEWKSTDREPKKKAFLVDFENVKSAGLVGLDQVGPDGEVIIMYSVNSNTISFEMHQKILRSTVKILYYQTRRTGKNALDFQLASLLGYLLASGDYSHLYVVSNDAGFDVLRDFWTSQFIPNGCIVQRRSNIESCLIHSQVIEQQKNRAMPREEPETEKVEIIMEAEEEPVPVEEPEAPAQEAEVLPEPEKQPEPETPVVRAAYKAGRGPSRRKRRTGQPRKAQAEEPAGTHSVLVQAAHAEGTLEAAQEPPATFPEAAVEPRVETVQQAQADLAEADTAAAQEPVQEKEPQPEPEKRELAQRKPDALVEEPTQDAAVERIMRAFPAALVDFVDGETCRKIAATLVKTHGKQDFYRRIIGNYGQKKGLEIYKKVKSEYMNLKKMLENAQSAAS